MDDILPLLKPSAWELQHTMVCRQLATFGTRRLPWVAYGWDRPDTFEMLGLDHPAAVPAGELDGPALANLRARPATWESITIKLGWFKKVRFLICGDDFLAAERILDADFLLAAQHQLAAKMLAVGIPRRGMLMACDGMDKDALARFAAAVEAQYHRAESPPISPMVFAAVDGKLIGHLDDDDETDEQVEAGDDPDGDTERDGLYVQTLTLDRDRAVICAGGEPLDELESRIRSELDAMIDRYGPAMRAEVKIIPDLNARSATLDAWMPALGARLGVPVSYGME